MYATLSLAEFSPGHGSGSNSSLVLSEWIATQGRLIWTGECLNVLVSEGFGVVELPSQLGGSSGSGNSFMEEDSLDMFAVFLLLPPNEDSHVPRGCHL